MLKRVSKLSEAMSLFIRNLTMKRNNILMTFWMQVIFIYLFIYLFLADKLKETEKIMTPFDF
jgi:predicted membrane protein